jgi:hypothetical protein
MTVVYRDREGSRRELKLRYHLLCRETWLAGTAYGVEVCSSMTRENGIVRDRAEVFPLPLDKEETMRLLNCLAEGTVTPVTLQDVVRDLIG